MTLNQMKERDTATIKYICEGCLFKRRLFDLGLIAGQKITCTNKGAFGTPIAYEIRGSKFAMRKNDAKEIEVTL